MSVVSDDVADDEDDVVIVDTLAGNDVKVTVSVVVILPSIVVTASLIVVADDIVLDVAVVVANDDVVIVVFGELFVTFVDDDTCGSDEDDDGDNVERVGVVVFGGVGRSVVDVETRLVVVEETEDTEVLVAAGGDVDEAFSTDDKIGGKVALLNDAADDDTVGLLTSRRIT